MGSVTLFPFRSPAKIIPPPVGRSYGRREAPRGRRGRTVERSAVSPSGGYGGMYMYSCKMARKSGERRGGRGVEALRGIGSIRPIRWGSRYRREGRSRPFPCALFTARGGGNVRTQTSLLLYTILAYLSTVFLTVFQVCEIPRTLDRLRPPRTGSLHGVRGLYGGSADTHPSAADRQIAWSSALCTVSRLTEGVTETATEAP